MGFSPFRLLSAMNYDCVPTVREQTMGINYGFEKVRFMAPGAGRRAHPRPVSCSKSARFRGAGMIMLTYLVTIEIENASKKPALTATWLTISQFDPKDRPQTLELIEGVPHLAAGRSPKPVRPCNPWRSP
jgi:hypothetical protein